MSEMTTDRDDPQAELMEAAAELGAGFALGDIARLVAGNEKLTADEIVDRVAALVRERARPWKYTPEDEERDGPYADHVAWRRWIYHATEAVMPDGSGAIDPGMMEHPTDIALYNVMSRLADGDPISVTEADQ